MRDRRSWGEVTVLLPLIAGYACERNAHEERSGRRLAQMLERPCVR